MQIHREIEPAQLEFSWKLGVQPAQPNIFLKFGLSRLISIFLLKFRFSQLNPFFFPTALFYTSIGFGCFLAIFEFSRLNSHIGLLGLACPQKTSFLHLRAPELPKDVLSWLNSKKTKKGVFLDTFCINSGVLRVVRSGSGAKAPPLAAHPDDPTPKFRSFLGRFGGVVPNFAFNKVPPWIWTKLLRHGDANVGGKQRKKERKGTATRWGCRIKQNQLQEPIEGMNLKNTCFWGVSTQSILICGYGPFP